MEEQVMIVEDELASLPEGWRWKTMEEVAEVVNGATPKTDDPANYEGGTIAWLTPADLSGYTEKFIDQGARFITKKGLVSCSTHLLPKGTVLFTSRAPIGYVAIASGEVCTNQGFKSYVPDTKQVTSNYLYWWLKGAKQMAEAVASGTTFLELSTVKARKLPVPLAPLPEQRRIVSAIERQLGRLDAAVARLHAAKAKLKRYRQAVLKAAVEEIEVDAVEENFGSISELITSGSRGWAEYYAASGDTFIRAQNLKYDRLDLSDIAYVKLPAKVDGLRTQVQQNDILITITGANVTKTALVTEVPEGRTFVNQHIALVRLKNPAQAPFVYRWIISPAHGRGILEKLAYGAGKPGLNLSNIRDLLIPIPPQEDQVQTVAKLEAIDSVNDEMETTLDAQLAQAVRLRQSVLKRAFEGRLV